MKFVFKRLILFYLILLGGFLRAEEVEIKELNRIYPVFKLSGGRPLSYEYQRLSITSTLNQYFGEAKSSFQPKNYSILWPQFLLNFEQGGVLKKIDMGLILIPDEGKDPYINARELYWLQTFKSGVKWGFGRRDIRWSSLDHEWNIGLWQPLLAFNYLRPIEQGTLGLFLDLNTKFSKIKFSVSPYFIPSQLPKVIEKSGFVVSRNRWFVDPIVDLGLNSVKTKINYNLDMPNFLETISRPSFYFSFLNNYLKNSAWIRGSYAYKPMNHFHISVEQPHIQNQMEEASIHVNVIPNILYHHIGTLEWGFEGKEFDLFLSLTRDSPESNREDKTWLEMPTGSLNIIGSKINFSLNFLGLFKTWAGLGYYRIIDLEKHSSEMVRPNDPDFKDIEISFDRFNYRDALSFDLYSKKDDFRSLGWNTKVRFIKSFSSKGEALIGTLTYNWTRNWRFHMNLDMIGHETGEGPSFFNKYRGNDSFSAGLKYVF